MYTFIEARHSTKPEDHMPAYWLRPEDPDETELLRSNMTSFVLAAANENLIRESDAAMLATGFTRDQVYNIARKPFETVFSDPDVVRGFNFKRVKTLASAAITGRMNARALLEEITDLQEFTHQGDYRWTTAQGLLGDLGEQGVTPRIYPLDEIAEEHEIANLEAQGVDSGIVKLDIAWPVDSFVGPQILSHEDSIIFGHIEEGNFSAYQNGIFVPSAELR